MKTDDKFKLLKNNIQSMHSAAIAFSGGVDSSFLLHVASQVLQEKAIAVTAVSATSAGHELEFAADFARNLGVEHIEIMSGEMELPEFINNSRNRCYICKKHRFAKIIELAKSRGMNYVLDGENVDDASDYRPGSKAARELGVISPLRDAGLTKDEIRLLSRELNLPTWNRPAYACLASRIPYDQEITKAKLRQVDDAENFLREHTVCRQVRVRHYGEIAAIEVNQECLSEFVDAELRRKILDHFGKLGFIHIMLNLAGYTMGSLNK